MTHEGYSQRSPVKIKSSLVTHSQRSFVVNFTKKCFLKGADM